MKVLIADDTPTSLVIASSYTRAIGHECITARNGAEAVTAFEHERPDLVLLDVEMPTMNGYEAARHIKQSCEARGEWIPIIFLSGRNDDDDIARGIEAGADDYLTKPVSRTVLAAKLNAMQRIAQMRHQLARANQELDRLSRLDGLTGTSNRRHLDETLDREFRQATRHSRSLAVVLCDIDHFKAFNDHYGHLAGDQCLRDVATVLRHVVRREDDLVARYGGEEFAVVLPVTVHRRALHMANAIRTAVEARGIAHARSPTADVVTLSLGVASWTPLHNASAPAALLHAADEALYQAKARGRNRVESV